VVALLRNKQLIVANAGDSRCVLCRGGQAVDMSFDHKPESVIERDRITKAGGCVTVDGRVNGGLNLSRAIGSYCTMVLLAIILTCQFVLIIDL
jgi:protein phosphatase 1G